MKAFVLAGGLGERLRPLTDRLPKCLAPINGSPLLAIWLDLCACHGITEVLINVSRHADAVERFLREWNGGVAVRLVRESEPMGNAGTVRANQAFVEGEESFFVLYADNLTDASLAKLLAFHRRHDAPLSMGLFRAPIPKSAGIVQLGPAGIVCGFHEKPANPAGDLANAGIYVARQSLFEAIPRRAGVIDFGTDVFPNLVGRMYATLVDGYLLDIGTPAALTAGASEWAARTRAHADADANTGLRRAL
jgi:mannose-1-phosphate guanylyltransferase